MSKKGFTLVELAMVLIIIGLLMGIGITALGILVKRAKLNETKEAVNSAVEAVLGYTYSSGKLPDNTKFSQIIRQKKDAFGKELVYIYDRGLLDYCGRLKSNIKIEICKDKACSTPEQTIENVAFIVLSGSANYNNQTAGSQEVSSPTTIKVYEYGVKVDNYPSDVNREDEYDDIVKWVTLDELHQKNSCKPLKIDTNYSLPEGVEDTPYRTKLKVTGGKPPYSFGTWNAGTCDTTSLWSGSGLSLTSDGYITGTVNTDTDSNPGSITGCSSQITISDICVRDSLGDEIPAENNFIINVRPKNVQIITDSLPPAYEGSSYSVSFSATGGGDSYNWNIDGSLPPGLTFSNGNITGTVSSDSGCSNPPPYNFTISASSCGMTAYKGYSLTVIDPDCSSAGGGSGGGGNGGGSSCPYGSDIIVENTGNTRYVEIGSETIIGCSTIGSDCIQFNAIRITDDKCFRVYRRSTCRSREGTFYYEDVYNADTNKNCRVYYNDGSLEDDSR